jgi:peroxiredoxin
LAQLESHKDRIATAGLKLVAVAMGEPKHARRYCGKLTADITCLSNKMGEVYRAYGIGKAGWTDALNPDLIKASIRAAAAGHVQGQATGDVAMLGATFIVDTEGIIRYAHYNSHAGDHPDLDRLLASIQSRN